MTEDDVKKIARDLLETTKARYDRCIGAALTKRNERDIWVVFFSRKKPKGILMMLPDEIIVHVDDLTGEAEVFPSL